MKNIVLQIESKDKMLVALQDLKIGEQIRHNGNK